MKAYLLDLSERVARTFAAGFLGAVTLPQITTVDVSALQAGAFAGWSGVATLLLGLLTRYVGSPDTVSMLSSK